MQYKLKLGGLGACSTRKIFEIKTSKTSGGHILKQKDYFFDKYYKCYYDSRKFSGGYPMVPLPPNKSLPCEQVNGIQ